MSDEFQESTGWRKEPGDSITGTVSEISQGQGDYGPYPIVSLSDATKKDANGNETHEDLVAIHAFHTVLRNELAKRRPKPGDSLTIKYLGKTPDTKERNGYHSYRVQGGSGLTYDWSQEEAYVAPPNEPVHEPVQATPDLPVETTGLPDLPPRESVQRDLSEQYGEVPF